jgi:hypothetical protein
VSVRAAPQCLSGRTSYLRVRLAFHPYPQLIPQICNSGGFGPPAPVTAPSPWPWVAHPVSGRPPATGPDRRPAADQHTHAHPSKLAAARGGLRAAGTLALLDPHRRNSQLHAACWALRAGRCVRSTRRQQAAGLAGALFGLAFARAASLGQGLSPPPQGGHSPAHSSRGTPSGRSPCPFQPAQRPAPRQGIPPEGSGHRRTGPGKGQQPSDSVWADDFRFCFTPLAGVLFTVPSRYWCTIGRLSGYVALERGRPSFPQGSSCPVVLTHPPHRPGWWFGYGALTPSGRPFQAVRLPQPRASCRRGDLPPPPGGPCNPRRT